MAGGFTPQFLHGLTTAEFVDGRPTFSTHQLTNAAHQSVSSGRDGYLARSVLRIYSRILGLCWLPGISRMPNSANATGRYENSSSCCCMTISPNFPSRSMGYQPDSPQAFVQYFQRPSGETTSTLTTRLNFSSTIAG